MLSPPSIYTIGSNDTCNISYPAGHVWHRHDATTFGCSVRTDCVRRDCVVYQKSTGLFYFAPQNTNRMYDVTLRKDPATTYVYETHNRDKKVNLWSLHQNARTSAYTHIAECFVVETIDAADLICVDEMLLPANKQYHTLLNCPTILKLTQYMQSKGGFTPEQNTCFASASYYGSQTYIRAIFAGQICLSLFNLAFYMESAKTPNTFWQAEMDSLSLGNTPDLDVSASYYYLRQLPSSIDYTSGNKTKPSKIKNKLTYYTNRERAAMALRSQLASKLKDGKYTPVAITDLRRQVIPPFERIIASLPAVKRSIIRG
jgi:hypothetical protein